MRHDLLDPGDPLGVAGATVVDDKDIEDDNQGDPKDLKHIKTPALVIGAEYDTMDPAYMKWMSEQLPNGSFLYCPEGSHMAMWDDAEVYHEGIKEFIGRV